jgi:hypothetical protein
LEAYVLINVEANVSWQIAEASLKIEGVKTIHVVTGQFDAVAVVQFSDLDDLRKIIDRIQHEKGVLRTQSLIIIPPPARTSAMMPGLSEEEKTGLERYPDR